jgi:hypothetical protein
VAMNYLNWVIRFNGSKQSQLFFCLHRWQQEANSNWSSNFSHRCKKRQKFCDRLRLWYAKSFEVFNEIAGFLLCGTDKRWFIFPLSGISFIGFKNGFSSLNIFNTFLYRLRNWESRRLTYRLEFPSNCIDRYRGKWGYKTQNFLRQSVTLALFVQKPSLELVLFKIEIDVSFCLVFHTAPFSPICSK